MWDFGALSQQGWRRTGAINVFLASICEVALLVCFILSLSNCETSSIGSTRIFEGSCERASALNTIIHLILNIISTGILASSNFFMQIVISPSRKEINQSHARLRALKIGLQSPTNIPFLSRIKQICWFILLLSSIPIHLFFNSAVYSTAYQSVSWNTTVATSHFAQRGIENQTYWLPGASLSISGKTSPVQKYVSWPYSTLPSTGQNVFGFGDPWFNGVHFTAESDENDRPEFDENDSPEWYNYARKAIAITAERCAGWTNLSPQACMDEFRPYKYHTKFKDVVIVVGAGNPDLQGWKRSQVFDFDPKTNLSSHWDSIVPPDGVNSLWFFTRCILSTSPRQTVRNPDYVPGSEDYDANATIKAYEHSCGRLFGLNMSQPMYQAENILDVVSLSFVNDGLGGTTTKEEISKGYFAHSGARDLQIDHCLAEPTTCQVRLSNVLILIVTICVLIKIATCTYLLRALADVSLVTPGDAIASFISDPDPATKGLSTIALPEVQDLECLPRRTYSITATPELALGIRPQRWDVQLRRLHSSVFRGIWVQIYYPVFLAMAALLVGVVASSLTDGLQNFGKTQNYTTWQLGGLPLNYLATLIWVNVPQLILSFLYLTVNALHTQLQVEQEWNSYSCQYAPLRVSYPTGDQISTYRLQLPYKYSVPLIAVSILLHWLVSNSLFLLVVEGDAGANGTSMTDLAESLGVSSDAMIAIGYSGLSVLIFFCVCVVVAMSPCFFGYRKLKNDMVVGGTNSLVLSAACHVPRISSTTALRNRNGETAEIRPDLEPAGSEDDDSGHEYKEYLAEVARGNVRWGAMPLPPDLVGKIEVDNDEPVMHLGFGAEGHDVQAPQTGVLYA